MLNAIGASSSRGLPRAERANATPRRALPSCALEHDAESNVSREPFVGERPVGKRRCTPPLPLREQRRILLDREQRSGRGSACRRTKAQARRWRARRCAPRQLSRRRSSGGGAARLGAPASAPVSTALPMSAFAAKLELRDRRLEGARRRRRTRRRPALSRGAEGGCLHAHCALPRRSRLAAAGGASFGAGTSPLMRFT